MLYLFQIVASSKIHLWLQCFWPGFGVPKISNLKIPATHRQGSMQNARQVWWVSEWNVTLCSTCTLDYLYMVLVVPTCVCSTFRLCWVLAGRKNLYISRGTIIYLYWPLLLFLLYNHVCAPWYNLINWSQLPTLINLVCLCTVLVLYLSLYL